MIISSRLLFKLLHSHSLTVTSTWGGKTTAQNLGLCGYANLLKIYKSQGILMDVGALQIMCFIFLSHMPHSLLIRKKVT